MKFRAKIFEILSIHKLTRVVATVSKLAKRCVLRLTAERIYFILLDQSVCSLWCECPQKGIFDEYHLEGPSDVNNEIYLECNVDSLAKALRSAHDAKSVKIKLTRKHGSSLTMEIELGSNARITQLLVHDVPVINIARRLWSAFDEPDMPNFDVKVILPTIKTLRNVVERIKNFSNSVLMSVSRSQTLTLQVESDEVSVKTCFQGLDVTFSDLHESFIDEIQIHADIRRVAQFLSGQQFNPDTIICNIVRHRMIHFLVIHEDLTMQYFIPAVEV